MLPDHAAMPPVSILIPTHNRPDYFELALRSALAQTYDNLEIVVSDNSDDERTCRRLAPYMEKFANIRYARAPGCTAIENFQNCYELARSDYVNYLMDDDLFHVDKIRIMMAQMLAHPQVGLVTSVRQLIDSRGKPIPAAPPFDQAFVADTLIGGLALGRKILTEDGSIVGEPTTPLFRKSDLGARFGLFHGRQYTVLVDVASWLAILSHKDCIYLTEPLSCFRVHPAQDQRQRQTRIKGNIEGLQLFCDAYEYSRFLPRDAASHALLQSDLSNFMARMFSLNQDLRAGGYELDVICALIRQASAILLRGHAARVSAPLH